MRLRREALPPSGGANQLRNARTAAKYPSAKTQVHAIDFSDPKADYAALKAALDPLDVGVLGALPG